MRRFQYLRVATPAICSPVILAVLCGCSTVDPAPRMIRAVERMPPEKRPPNWEKTKERMSRRAPTVGEVAPDFSLSARDGSTVITRSIHQADRPLVLIFGSFT